MCDMMASRNGMLNVSQKVLCIWPMSLASDEIKKFLKDDDSMFMFRRNKVIIEIRCGLMLLFV